MLTSCSDRDAIGKREMRKSNGLCYPIVVVRKFEGSRSGNLSKFVEEFAEQFGNEAIDVVRIISFVLRAFLRVLNEAAARLPSGVSGIQRGGSTERKWRKYANYASRVLRQHDATHTPPPERVSLAARTHEGVLIK